MISKEQFATRKDLNGAWQFAYAPSAPGEALPTMAALQAAGLALYPCTVPGNFELDVLAQRGNTDDLYRGMNILAVEEFERMHVWYARTFSAAALPDHIAQLVFEGIDCYAEIYLNGRHLASTDNMLIEHVFTVDHLLQAENELVVHIRPAVVEAKQYPYPPRVTAGGPINYEALYTRKAPHMYGWDIMPRVVSAGLWRPVSLRYRPVERFDYTYLETTSLAEDHQRAGLMLHYRTTLRETAEDRYLVELTMTCGERTATQQRVLNFCAGDLSFTVDAPLLWWPRGAGEPHLYQVQVRLVKNGQLIDQQSFTHGIRLVSLAQTDLATANGEGEFCFFVNHEKIFVCGTNWVPLDAFHSRDAVRLDAALALLAGCNCNMVRCWGGNVYESDRFFDYCDAHGIMVWQDFAMACAVYPQDQEFGDRLAAEVRAVVRRLRHHASVMLWSGDNECDLAYITYCAGDPNANVLTRRVIPEVLRQEDGTRPYLPSSPYLGPAAYRAGDYYAPEGHLWGPRDYFKSAYYLDAPAHFTSEIGYLATPVASSIKRFITPEHRWPLREDDPEWVLHGTSPHPEWHPYDYRIECLNRHLKAFFGTAPNDFDAYIFASQAAQAEAYKFFIERFRGTKWRRTGIIWWNLLDGWPQCSDAVVDYYHQPKLAYHFIANVQQPLLVLCQEPTSAALPVVVTNDTRLAIALRYRVRDLETNALVAAGEAVAAANALTPLAEIAIDPTDQRCYLCEWESDLGHGRNHYVAGAAPFALETYVRWYRVFHQGIVPADHEAVPASV